jgi:ATP-dependent DNA ligase
VRLCTRDGHGFTARFPLVVAAVAALSARTCLIDGEAIVSDEAGLAVFAQRSAMSSALIVPFSPYTNRRYTLAR